VIDAAQQNIDRLAKEGATFTSWYGQASCTAGRANFITGELPIRTGMTTVGQAGAAIGLPAEAATIFANPTIWFLVNAEAIRPIAA
jgi:arylsulfatase A-like enzyme